MAGSFEVTGQIRIERAWQPYKKVVEAPNEAQATERFLTLVGSKHRLKRSEIRIDGVKKTDGE
jgi:large subunit ribosomal protein LX